MASNEAIVVPYTPAKLHPETAQWAASNNARMYDVSSDSTRYYRALCEWWAEDGDLLIVEHDMLPADGVVEEMLNCSEPWCSSPYQLRIIAAPGLYLTMDGITSETFSQKMLDHHRSGGDLYCTDALGCTKFSAELKARLPELVVESGTVSDWEPYAWRFNDVRISGLLRRDGVTPHLHASSAHLAVQRLDILPG